MCWYVFDLSLTLGEGWISGPLLGLWGRRVLTGKWSTEERKTLEKNLAIFAVLVATEGES